MSGLPVLVLLVIHLVTFVLVHSTKVFHILPDEHPSFTLVPQCQAIECYNLTALLKSNMLSDSISNVNILLYPGIHTINSAIKEVFSINNANIFKLTATNLTEGATIECSGSTGFAFSSCTNLTITGITFEGCGAHFESKKLVSSYHTVTSNFVLLIFHSINVQLSDIRVRNGSGIGLLAVNVHGSFNLSNSGFVNNTCNLYYFSNDRDSINSSDTVDIRVMNSQFDRATTCSHKDKLIGSVRTAGIVFKLFQTKFNVTAAVNNVTMVKNHKYNMVVELNYHTSKISIENITSVSVDNKLGLWILSTSVSTDRCYSSSGGPCTVATINNAHFKRGGVIITNKGYRQNQLQHITTDIYRYQIQLSNIIIENYTGSQYSFFVSEVPRLIISNITIRNTTDRVLIKNCNALLRGHFVYKENHGSVLLLGQNKIVMGSVTVVVMQNTAVLYAPIFITGSYIETQNSSISILNNTGSDGGGIVLFNSTITFGGNSRVNFLHNRGSNGGAMTFYQKAVLILSETTNLTFVGNHANKRGGAIFVQDEDYVEYDYIRKITHFEYGNFYSSSEKRAHFHLTNNTAIEAGSAVYGGTISYDDFHFYGLSSNDTSVVSSVPLQICLCNSTSKPNCGVSRITVGLLPGQSYELEAIAVGAEYGNKEYGTVPSTVRASFMEQSHGQLKQVEYVQSTETYCTKLSYTVNFSSEYELLQLTTTEHTWKNKKIFEILFQRKNCSVGFMYDTSMSECVCDKTLTDHGISCDINTLTVQRPDQKWISTTYTHLNSSQSQQQGVLVHDHCPFDYCISTNGSVQSLNLNYPNQQCAFNRSGILCGACEANFSNALGTSKCKQCTKPWIALIIPLVAVAGTALVVGLLFLNLTVSVGTINGPIFYANIVRANHAVFFPYNLSTSFLGTFIAWLNLDLGIETCFYDGFNAYSKTWFQFLFPLYIWFILITIIVVSHYSTRISRLVGNNAVQALATLFLLSYAKLLRIIIMVFSSTELVYPDGYHRRVWLYDGNVDYLTGKHIPLFIAALILLILISIPFTVTLLCIQWLQKLSNRKVLFWVRRLQPLFDAYTGPYKIKHRYWIGLLLLIRVCLFLVFSFNTSGNPLINMLATSVSMSCLFAYLSLIGGVYKRWWLNLVETIFILNLLILSIATFYQINTAISIEPITYASTGISLSLFIAIILYHIATKVLNTKQGQQIMGKLKHHLLKLRNWNEPTIQSKPRVDLSGYKDKVTYSVIQLEETLI